MRRYTFVFAFCRCTRRRRIRLVYGNVYAIFTVIFGWFARTLIPTLPPMYTV